MGDNQAIGQLADIARPDVGIDTAIDPAPLVIKPDHMTCRDALTVSAGGVGQAETLPR